MRECKKCDNLVTDEQVKNCEDTGCPIRLKKSIDLSRFTALGSDAAGSHYVQHEGADIDAGAWETFSGSPEPSDQKTGFDFGAVSSPPEEGDQYHTIKNFEYPRARFITVKRWKDLHEDRNRLDAGLVFTSYENCERYFDHLVSQSQVTTISNIAPGTGDGFSVAPRQEPIPSSMAMKFEVFGDPGQLANLSQRVFEILNEDASVKIREFNYYTSG